MSLPSSLARRARPAPLARARRSAAVANDEGTFQMQGTVQDTLPGAQFKVRLAVGATLTARDARVPVLAIA